MEAARRHYEQRGYLVEAAPAGTRADLVVEKNGRRRLVRVDVEGLGTYQIGALAAEAKRARTLATAICPASPEVLEACDQFGVEHISPEGLGEEGPVIAAARSVTVPAAPAHVPVEALPPRTQVEAAPPRTWRWVVVAVIWVLAVLAWSLLLSRAL